MHGDDQGVIVREMNHTSIYLREHDWLARDQRGTSQDRQIVDPTGLVDIDGLLPRGRSFEWAGTEDGINLSVANESTAHRTLPLLDLENFLLHLSL